MSERLFFSDPVLGSIFFEGIESRLINSAELNRLKHIKQLATAYIFFPFAIHTRFHHSIGVSHLTKQFLSSLPVEITSLISFEDRKRVACAALLHDIGHSAWGHAGEIFVSFIGSNIHHESMSKDLLIEGDKYDEYFSDWNLERLYDIIPDKKERALIAKPIVGEPLIDSSKYNNITDEEEKINAMTKDENELRFLSQLINSYSDFDRIEYLLRDSFFTGVFRPPFCTGDIFPRLGIKNIHQQNQLCYLDRNFGESLTLAREIMYASVYSHEGVLLTEEMLGRAWVELYNSDAINQDINKLWFSTDSQILEMLKNSRLEFSQFVYNSINSGKTYEIIEYKILSDLDENIRDVLKKLNEKRDELLEIEQKAVEGVAKKGDLILGLYIKKDPKEMNAIFVNYDGKLKLLGESEIIKPLSHEDYVNQRSKFIIGVKENISSDKKSELVENVYRCLTN